MDLREQSRESRIHYRIRFEVNRDIGTSRAGRLDVELEAGELSVITNRLGGEPRALLPLEHVPPGRRIFSVLSISAGS